MRRAFPGRSRSARRTPQPIHPGKSSAATTVGIPPRVESPRPLTSSTLARATDSWDGTDGLHQGRKGREASQPLGDLRVLRVNLLRPPGGEIRKPGNAPSPGAGSPETYCVFRASWGASLRPPHRTVFIRWHPPRASDRPDECTRRETPRNVGDPLHSHLSPPLAPLSRPQLISP